MSKFKKKLGRRIMAVALSLAMIMSNMTVYAEELNSETQIESTVEEAANDAEIVEVVVDDDENETSLTQKTVTSDKEDEDAVSKNEEDKDSEIVTEDNRTSEVVDEDDKTSEKMDEEVSEKEKLDRTEEQKTSDIDNKEAVAESPVDFKSLSSEADLTVYAQQGITIGNSFKSLGNGHGIQASDASATVVLSLQADKTATITVETCIHNDTDKNETDESNKTKMNYSFGESTGSLQRIAPTGSDKDDPKYVLENASGEVTLSFTREKTYIHSITVNYNAGGSSDPTTIVKDGASIDFFAEAVKKDDENNYIHNENDPVKTTEGFSFNQFKWFNPNNNHGIAASGGTIECTIEEGKRAVITVIGCQHSSTATISSTSGVSITKSVSNDGETAPQYMIVGAEGNVKLTFNNQHYLHKISVKYMADNEHAVVVSAGENGTASASVGYIAEGETVTLTAEPNSGYGVKEWQVIKPEGEGALTISVDKNNPNVATFEMPASDVEVKAVFEATGASHTITVTETVENGTVTAGTVTSAKTGVTVNMDDVATVTPNDGYMLKEWDVTYAGENGSTQKVELTKTAGKYSFIMPDANVTVKPIFEKIGNFTTTHFYEKFVELGHKKKDPVDDIVGFTAVSGVLYNDNQHGLSVSNGVMKLNLAPEKKYDIIVWGCGAYGAASATTMEATSESGDLRVISEPEATNGNEKAPKFTVLKAEGEVTLTFGGGTSYVHSIIIEESSNVEKYEVTVTDDGNGTAKADIVIAEEGTEITLTATPDNRYQFKEWKVISGDVKIENNKFTMPASDVEIKAIFEPIIRRDWDFANDENLKGDKGAAVTGKTETVAGLSIDATAEGSGWDSTGTGTDGAAVKNKTIITIPVEGGACKVKVSAESAAYTVDGKAAEAAEEIFDCTGSDGKVVIEITADNHIKAINVTPVVYAKAGTYNFAMSKNLKIDGFTFNKFEHKGNDHGVQSLDNGASVTLNLSGKANVAVLGCRYGIGTGVEMTATSGEVTKSEVNESGDPAPEFSIRKADAGELTLEFTNMGTAEASSLWIHTINIEYLPEDLPDVYTEGIDVWDFGAEQLQSTDTVKYNNKLTEEIINSWFPNVAPGTTNATIASFEVKDDAGNVDFMFNDGGYSATHRLRTTNTKLTRFDSKELTIGDAKYTGYVYSNKGSDKGIYVGVKLNAGDVMTAVVSSNGNAYTITVEDPEGRTQNFAKPKGASIITYYATKSGMHKIYNGTDEKLVVGRVTRQHSKTVNVSGSVTRKSGVDGALTLTFTCKESGKVEKVTVAEDGTYSVNLFENYHYDVVVSPTIYIIEEGKELELGAANEAQTYTHNITVGAVTLRKLSGAIVGLDDDAMNSLKINFEKPEDKLYLPVMEIDKAAKTYTVLLESGVEYLLVTEGINDYELDSRANNNSDRIRITSDAAGRNITYKKKPVYKVTIEPVGATLADLANATFTFTNLKEEGYVYNFTGTDNIELRDGTYSVAVSNSGVFRQKLTSNLVVDGSDVTKKIAFDSTPATKWDFVNANTYENGVVKNPCDGLSYSGEGTWKYHGEDYGSILKNIIISVPVTGSGKVAVEVGYAWDISSGDIAESVLENGERKTIEIPYNNTDKVDITVGSATTTYIKSIEVIEAFEYKATITVGKDKDYQTINDALEAVGKMDRTADQAVTIAIDPGNYEEMLVIETSNIKLVNAAGENASIGLRNKGVDIDANAVRITSYYGHGYSYYSMGNDCKWSAEVLEANKENGCESYTNPGSGSTDGSYWNATVVINASNVSAEGIIFENSFNQYISKKAAEDVIVKQSSAKEGSVPRASMAYGDTTVQDKAYVERAAALAIMNNQSHISFDNCKFIGRQDTLYGGVGVTAAFYGCSVYGGTDYIFGGMRAVFAKCELVFNTSDENKNDVGYITAAQQQKYKDGQGVEQPATHGYLMYNCHVTSTMPGVDTASKYTSKPGYLGRPWQAHTGEAVFYKTIIDEADAHWSTEGEKLSLITPVGWDKSLSDISALSQEFGTYELSGVDNSGKRVDWANVLTEEKLVSGDPITVETFLGDWDVFAGKDMTVVLPNDEGVPAPAQPKAIITPEAEKEDEVIKGASIVLSAERGAKVYYNVNADGNPTETPEMLYKGAIDVTDENIKDNTITVKAIAVKYGKTSDVATFTYKVVEAPAPAKPVLTPETDANVLLGSSIKMSAPYGAKIYYNVNAEAAPTDKDTLYTGKLGVKLTLDMVNKEDSTVKIQAVAVMTGKTSEVTTAVYNVIVNKPVASVKNGYQFPDGGGKVKLTADEDVTILYTTGATADDAADPTLAESNPATYDKESSGITVSQDTVIKAVAKRGSKYSAVVTLEYLVPLSMPVATPESGSVLPKNARTVRLSADEGTTIYYTIGADSDPTVESEARKTYDPAQGIEVIENNTIIKAVAVKDDRQSMVAVFTYTISDEEFPQAETPTVISVNGKPVTGSIAKVEADTDVVIKLATATEGAAIYYTIDDSIPTLSSSKYNDETGVMLSKVAEDTVIKAIAVKEKYIDSEVLTFTVKIGSGDDTDPDITVDDKAGIEIKGLRDTYEYTGAAITPDFEVEDNGIKENGTPRVLILGTDYTVKYKNNKKEGETATITVIGKGNYSGKEVEATFKIESMPKVTDQDVLQDLKGAKIAKIAPMPYTGEAQYPKFELTLKNGSSEIYEYVPESNQYVREKDKSADINVTISGNRNKGTATILVRGKNDSRGKVTSVKATFKITPVDLSTANVEVAESADYAVKGATPAVTVSYQFEGAAVPTVLKAGRDYVVKYSGNKKAGATAKVVITGKGNYTKKVQGTFTVKALSMENTRLVAADVYEGAKAAKLKAVVVDANGDALKASQYTVKAYTDKDCKTKYDGDDRGKCTAGDVIYLQAVAKDINNLEENTVTPEPLEVTVGANIAKAKVKLMFKTKAYTGTYVKLAEGDLQVTIKDGRDTKTLKLKPEIPVEGEKYDYEIISYSNNIYKGTATAVIRGIGKYSGTKTIKFKIAAKEMKKAKDPETTN